MLPQMSMCLEWNWSTTSGALGLVLPLGAHIMVTGYVTPWNTEKPFALISLHF